MNAEELANLAVRAKRERKRRGWTQQELANRTGVVSLGTVSNFERRKARPQPEHLRAILRALDLEMESGDAQAEETRGSWSPEVRVFLDVVGVFLSAVRRSAGAASSTT
jgi:transcriptional regulator with XRE-family HTH domain